MKTSALLLFIVVGLASAANAGVEAGDILNCSSEVTDAIALTSPAPRTPKSDPEVPQGLLRCGIAPGAIFRVIETGQDRLIVELKKGRVNMVIAEDGGAYRDLQHQYFAIPRTSENANQGSCVVLPISFN